MAEKVHTSLTIAIQQIKQALEEDLYQLRAYHKT